MNLSLNAYQMQAVHLLRALKGAPLACLHALHIMHPHALGRADLISFTGWNKDAVTKAMTLLVNVYFLAARVGRYESWCLTDKGKQLPLPLLTAGNQAQNAEIDARAPIEGDFFALEPSSSSGNIYVPDLIERETTTTAKSEGGKIALPLKALEIIDEWFDGCPQTIVSRAFQSALTRGDTFPLIEYRVIAWHLYTQSPLGRSIKARAIFVARKIENGERCPDFFKEMDSDWRYTNREMLRRLDVLDTQMDAEGDSDD